jgi:ferredoxin
MLLKGFSTSSYSCGDETTMVHVSIDRMECISCASCWQACPDIFEENPDDTFSEIVIEYRNNGNLGEGEIPEDFEGCARDAEDLCPVQIIQVG